MVPELERSLSTLLAFVLALICLSAPGVQGAAPDRAQTAQELVPGGLMSAFLIGSAQPLEAGADAYHYAEQKVTAPDGAAGDEFGISVAIDGDTALVGAPNHGVGENDYQGSVYVFTRSGTTWSFEQELTASDGAGSDHFGWSVAISGTIAVVGAHYDDVDANANQGSAYVFTRIGTTWGERDKLTAADGAQGDRFGESVALSGTTILVGVPYHDVGANTDQGSAYVFVPIDFPDWGQQAQLTASDGAADDYFGYSLAIDGDTALVGASYHDVGANGDQGSAYVFTRSGAIWTQRAQLTAADGAAADGFGVSVALSGGTALLGAYRHLVGANATQGSAYVFTGSGATWGQQAELTASDGAGGDQFGYSVAISGTIAVVGAQYDHVGANSDQGSAYVLTGSGAAWTQQGKLTASDGAADDYFGHSVALSGDTALVGAQFDDIGANDDQGSAYFFKQLPFAVYLPLVSKNAP
jgi:hypothetical protein